MTDPSNADQAEYWAGHAGHTWVAAQVQLDAVMQPVLDALLARAGLVPGDQVLDIGCGTGASSLQAATAVGASGRVLGADLSPVMLDLARRRASGMENTGFVLADAADHAFSPGRFSQMISRFGVMFFADPAAAFANIARAMQPGAPLTFAAWGPVEENPWFLLSAAAARNVVGAPPPVDRDAPGPFAFRDLAVVERILARAGFTAIEAETAATPLTPAGTLDEVAALAADMGPAARTLQHFNAGEAEKQAVAAELRTLLAPFTEDGSVRVPAAVNYVRARRPA